jgi:hypothetical protein
MKCDLCEHPDVHSQSNLLCECCAKMIERLLIVQQRMDPNHPHMVASDFYSVKTGAWID